MAAGLNLRVKPFAVASGRESRSQTETGNEQGLDLKWGVGRGLALDLTVNTDFAESEADEQQVNLSRFLLFQPEKREFFLENAGVFEFGPRSLFTPPTLRPFFSRRIGLSGDGQAVPIEWGARLTGRSGPWSVGALGAETEGDDWQVLRLRRQMDDRTTVGLISTRHAAPGNENRVYGLDADVNATERLKLRTFLARSEDSAEGGDGTGGVGAVYRGPKWRWSLDAMEIGEHFDAEAGFLLRRGVRRYAGSLTWVPRPEASVVRNYYFEHRLEAFTGLDGRLESAQHGADLFSFRTRKDDVFSLYSDLRYERLDEPFEIRRGVVIPSGEYRFGDLGMWVETNTSRPVSASGWYQRGPFYGGDRAAHGMTLRLRPGRHFRSESSWDHNSIDLPAGAFDTNLFRERLSLALTPDLATAAFVQFNDAAELLALNVRFNWIYRPGADLFLVLNETWDAPGLGRRSQRDRQAILKLTYLFSA
jgi:hypothetical protein